MNQAPKPHFNELIHAPTRLTMVDLALNPATECPWHITLSRCASFWGMPWTRTETGGHGSRLDRLARSVPDARAIGDSLVARGVKLRVGAIVYDPADPMGKMFFNILATFAKFGVDLLQLRTKEDMAIAKANGKLKGKPPKLNPRQQAHLVKLHREGSYSIPQLADLFSVSRPTVYRVLDKARHHTDPARQDQGSQGIQ